MDRAAVDRLVAVYDVFDILTGPNPPLYVMPASQAYRTWQPEVPFPMFVAAHLAVGPPPPPILSVGNGNHNNNNNANNNSYSHQGAGNSGGNGHYYGGGGGGGNYHAKNGGGGGRSLNFGGKNGYGKEFASGRNSSHRRRREKSSIASNDGAGKLARGSDGDTLKKKPVEKIESAPILVERYPADPSGGASVVITKTKGRVICRLEYSREFMLQCSLSPWTKLSPVQMPYIVQHFPELLPPGPQAFSPAEYKVKYGKLKQNVVGGSAGTTTAHTTGVVIATASGYTAVKA